MIVKICETYSFEIKQSSTLIPLIIYSIYINLYIWTKLYRVYKLKKYILYIHMHAYIFIHSIYFIYIYIHQKGQSIPKFFNNKTYLISIQQ